MAILYNLNKSIITVNMGPKGGKNRAPFPVPKALYSSVRPPKTTFTSSWGDLGIPYWSAIEGSVVTKAKVEGSVPRAEWYQGG